MADPSIMRRLMLFVLTLGLTSGQSSKLKYLVTASASMSYPSNETVCIYVTSSEVDATLTISLTAIANTIVFNTKIRKGDGPLHCRAFQVPPPKNGAEEIATLAIKITSGTFNHSEKKSVVIRSTRNGMFVQTDRPIYQPGDKIIMKAVHFTENLMANKDKFELVTLKDQQGNIVKQWKNVQPTSGMLDLFYKLSPDIGEGEYKVSVKKNDSVSEVPITVAKFVLPKFDLTIDALDSVSIHQSNFPMTICAKYTYGKPVRGRVIGKMCRFAMHRSDDICKPIDGKTDVNGCYKTQLDTKHFKFNQDGYNSYVDVEASLQEDGSGVERKATKNIYINDILATVVFKETRAVIKNGLDYRGTMTLMSSDGIPIADDDIEMYVNEIRSNEIYTTDKYGLATFKIESTQFSAKVIDLRARYFPRQPLTDSSGRKPVFEDGHASLIPSHRRSISQVKMRSEPFVLPCNKIVNLWADYFLDASEYSKKTIDFHYVIINNGGIVSSATKRHTIAPSGGLRSFFTFPVTVTADMSPAVTIIIYTGLDNKELIADSIKFPVTSCFPNTVSLKFSEEQTLPGSMINLHISAYPNSLCSIRAVDKSIELLKEEEKRSEDSVNQFLKDWDAATNGYPIKVEEPQKCPANSTPVFDRSPRRPDIYSLFEECGIKVLTNYIIRKPLKCISPSNIALLEMAFASGLGTVSGIITAVEEKVRKIFPSTWLMTMKSIRDTGELDYPVKVPDTITQWNADAFCISDVVGLGFSPKTHLQVFQPFFAEPIMPYSVKQGETLVLKVVVLNFLRQCIKVNITLDRSKDFQLQPCEGCSYSACLCSNPTFTFTWNIKPLTLGAININIRTEALDTTDLCDGKKPIVPTKGKSDIVQRRLIVEAHGIPVEKTRSMLICAFDPPEKIPLVLPNNVVLGSQSAEVTVTGDIMGQPLNNLNNLVRLPTGCGEQNMILLAPPIVVHNYLSATSQMTDEIAEKIRGFIEIGYQNELKYKHTDGSYSAFGNSDPSGSTWLTAFVVRIFFLCQKVIEIEKRHITEALDWLKKQQQSNGCFKNVGRVIHQELMGGVDSQIALTAYVTSAFLEIRYQGYDDVIEKAKQCLANCTQPGISIHTKAQCAYTYTLLGDKAKSTQLSEQLDKVAIKKDNKTYWSTSSKALEVDPMFPKPKPAIDVETTSYVVKAKVSGNIVSNTELAAAVPSIRWLYSQQNSRGGFTSTQDTVVAMCAITAYCSKTHVFENMPTITVTNDKKFTAKVTVNPKKPTEVLVVKLPDIPAVYTLEGSGSGCAYVQLTERHNMLNPEPEGTFILKVQTSSIQCPPHPLPSFRIEVRISLNTSKDENTNMALVEINLLSGFVLKTGTEDRLLSNDQVKKVEYKLNILFIYLDKITSSEIQLPVEVEQQSEVRDAKPAVVSVKDYYEISKHIETTYKNPCN